MSLNVSSLDSSSMSSRGCGRLLTLGGRPGPPFLSGSIAAELWNVAVDQGSFYWIKGCLTANMWGSCPRNHPCEACVYGNTFESKCISGTQAHILVQIKAKTRIPLYL